MKSPVNFICTLLIVNCCIVTTNAQYTIDDLNTVLSALKGEQDVSEVKEYSTIESACNSGYLTCDDGKVIGLDFQFSNLNGYIHEDITKLVDLEYVNLEYNYLDGIIPEGFSKMENLEELLLNGNFLGGPLPSDLMDLSKRAVVDLSQNTIKNADTKAIKKFNITNQFNLEGCRSPDSIFLKILESKLKIDQEKLDAVKPKEDTTYFKVVERMPRFPGCEKEEMTDSKRKNCAQEAMLKFIYKNLRYPTIARENGIEGMCVVQFTILKNGEVGYANVIRDIGARCGNASLWIVNRMNFICDPWVPGLQRGKPVKVLYTLPVKFALE